MKKAILLSLGMCLALFAATSTAAVIYQNDYQGETVGTVPPGWHWGTDICAHSVAYADVDGNIVIRHTGTVNNDTGAAADARFGSKWDITVSGNTSADPADYTISLKVRNVSGNWDPYPFGLAVLTKESPDAGHSFPTVNVAQADGWVHVEFNLADWTGDWWEASEWDLTNPNWSLEVGGPGWPGTSFPDGTSFTQIWEMDDLKIIMGSDTEPHDPNVMPDNGDGTVGTLISSELSEVTLGWMAGGDPNIVREYPVNPDVLGHYIYLSLGGIDDPNLYLQGWIEQAHAEDPYDTDPYNEYGPVVLSEGTYYFWQVEAALDDGAGNPCDPGDPNNTMGPVWTFTTIGNKPIIVSGPEHALADFSGNASLSITTGSVATHFRWFKVDDPDIQLTDGGIYSGTQTKTLNITGAIVADEGEFYAVAYNGDPDEGGTPSDPSKLARLWYPRLTSHYPFETLTDDVTPDIEGGFHAVMMQAGTDPLPGLSSEAIVGSSSLQLDNPDAADPNGQYAQIPAGVVDYMDITIKLWVRPSTLPGWARVLDFGTGTNNYLFLTAEAGWGVMRFAIRTPDVDEQLLEAGALTADAWHHVAVTITGNTGRLYHNGELVATNTNMTLNPIDVLSTLNYLGNSQWPDPQFDGLIDDLKIYNYARTTEQIAQDYLAVRGDWVCNYELYDLPFDYDGNCQVDLADFAIFAAAWLDHYRIYPE